LFLGVKQADRRERSGYLFPEFERLVNSGEVERPSWMSPVRSRSPAPIHLAIP
jgi:hypothetical protein